MEEEMKGKPAPDFTLPASNGENISLSDFKGKNVIVYFYPKDMTPGCTTEACDFRDHTDEFKQYNTEIIGISPDPIEKHQTFIDKHGLPFLLLADEDKEAAEAFGVWQLKRNFGKESMGIVRSTFIINKNGTIVEEWKNVKVKNHVEETLAYIKENL
ncbi:thioredoxin-dependent thiol peroxidase [Salibacterium salarium]|uniref:thioredoxin-dependent peroxiredoxin n=1 Tax=Salibacterium salarium TaxID=284579 RepID=A0A3R9QKS5_9BACI|nr:thioredoxin-dependent thiol peroxidase [Salibacterium salarium]RSL32569.1 thioredoxin-dependent thiol peroxidase [Salibacterium salarium]